MTNERREQIRHNLRKLAAAQATAVELFEQTVALLHEELALDPITFWQSCKSRHTLTAAAGLRVDRALFSVNIADKVCYLGNTLPFQLFDRLVTQANTYLAYEVLLADVWNSLRSDEAVRSVVKRLRSKLRSCGMQEVAAAIDGSVPGHYALKLPLQT